MTEQDYLLATNLAKMRIAYAALRSVMLPKRWQAAWKEQLRILSSIIEEHEKEIE